MKTPENYKIVYPAFVNALKVIEENAIKNNNADANYYTLKKFMQIAFEKCSRNSDYCNGWVIWFTGKRSTIFLRALMNEVGCNYWNSLLESNAIDTLDSIQYQLLINN